MRVLLAGLPLAFLTIAYLHNDVFPPLLSPEEEQAALTALAAGDQEAKALLIEHNLRLVAHIARKFESSGVDRNDLLSIGTIGLVKGIATYKPDKGARLATYSARCIENEILMHLRSIRNQKTELSLYDPVGVDKEGNSISLMDVLGDEGATVHERVELEEERRILREKLTVLEEKERFVLGLRYGLDGGRRFTQRDVAKRLGISRSYVSRIEKRAVEKLKKAVQAP